MTSANPLVVVSADSHVGPRLNEDLRSYCSAEYLDDFDRFAATAERMLAAARGYADVLLNHPNFTTPGHYDSAARLSDFDYDGVSCGVIFHGSENFVPMPFGPLFPGAPVESRELQAVGQQIYNRWLADFVSQSPHRHHGLAYLPMWDLDAAVSELEWAHDHGLKGVNFPAMRGDLLEYNNPAWDRFWAVCEERQLPIVTHVGTAGDVKYEGPEATALQLVESGGFYSHRAVWWLIFGGVFERYPGLRYVITETPGNWYPSLSVELDAIWNMFSTEQTLNAPFYAKVPRAPSEYMKSNVYFGASFASPYEVEQAVLNGFSSQLLWGSDYPHIEGTFVNPAGTDMPSVTRLALRNTFCHVPEFEARRMIGDNAIEVFGMDRSALQEIAAAIDAPSARDLATPIESVPEGASMHAFRSGISGWS